MQSRAIGRRFGRIFRAGRPGRFVCRGQRPRRSLRQLDWRDCSNQRAKHFHDACRRHGITVGPDGLVYVATTDPTSNPGFPVVNRYNATTGAQVGSAFIPFVNGAAQLSNAQGMAFGPDGHFYVADLGDNGPVKSFNASGGYLDTYGTQGGNAQSVAFNPAVPGNVYVATGSTIEQIDLTTHANTIIVQGASNPLTFNNGSDLTFGPGWQALRSGYL